MKDQPQTVQISCNSCAFIKHMHSTMLITLPICFYAEFIIQNKLLPSDLTKNKHTDKVTTLKYILRVFDRNMSIH